MTLREIVFNKLKETNKLDLWPKVRIEIFSMENQNICDKYIELYNSGYKCKNTINSWVAYILGICDEPPSGEMKITKTPKLADIDSDFDRDRREEVIDIVKDHFGHNNVMQICTYGQYRLKAAILNILKFKMSSRGEDPNTATAISSKISQEIEKLDITPSQKLDIAIESSQELAAYLRKYPEEREYIEKIIGAYSAIGKHAAGIIVCPEDAYKILPISATPKGPVTAMDKYDLEDMGLVKFDFLGLGNMTTIAQCLKLIEERHGRKINLSRDVDLNDKLCIERFNHGDVDTVFQFETPSFQEILANQVDVDSFNDLVLINAINRPGPKKFTSDWFYEKYRIKEEDEDGNIDPPVSPIGTYASNKRNPSRIITPHPLIEDLLKETYGIPVYQEQIMKMIQILSGASMADADKLRDAIGKKKMDLFDKCMKDFAIGCRKNGISEDVISEVSFIIQKFGKYGFNKSHACAYTAIGFWNMWLKTYYPAEWYASVFTTELSGNKNTMLSPCYCKGKNLNGKYSTEYPRKLDWYIYGASSGGFNGQCKRCDIYTPSLNISDYKDAIVVDSKEGPRIYLPFCVIGGLGSNTLPIIENRKIIGKYDNMEKFVMFSGVSESLAIKMIENGVLEDDFGSDKMKLLADLNYYLKVRREQKKSLQNREKKTGTNVSKDIQDFMFGDFKGVISIQTINDEIKQKDSSKKLEIDEKDW